MINNSIAKKNIGIFNTETISNQIPLGQLTKELLMDEIWTDSPVIGNSIQNILNHYNSDTKVVATPPVLDIEDLPKETNGSIRKGDTLLENSFIFYYVIALYVSSFNDLSILNGSHFMILGVPNI